MHVAVLKDEVLGVLSPKPGEIFVDATLGAGGHAKEIINKLSGKGILIGIDRDKEAINKINENLRNTKPDIQFHTVHGSYRDVNDLLESVGYRSVDAILLDLGLSSDQLAASRGFSFLEDAPLDMRFSEDENIPTAADILNGSTERELADIFWQLGEERSSRKIAKAIIQKRKKKKFEKTSDLVDLITKVKGSRRGKINPATKVFQALRIAVNDELGGLKEVLPKAIKLLNPGGRLAIISFHSLEDRIVKHFFKKASEQDLVKLLTKKPITATKEEIIDNPRSRSAKLRAIEKI
ncbi:MAG: 16S rRNA (cytosine(1402)-N(4))-methyltransferase RsmH [Patescibacteria group bacterium]|nr:16S rRNA (cytosine(1402)-N(4))-methyltransferase RsmH [Patescibacteria group bacterium]